MKVETQPNIFSVPIYSSIKSYIFYHVIHSMIRQHCVSKKKYQTLHLSICPSIYKFISIFHHLVFTLCLYDTLQVETIHLSIYLSICPSVHPSIIFMSIFLHVVFTSCLDNTLETLSGLTIHPSIYLSIHL